MTLREALQEGTGALAACSLDNPRLEAEVLLRHVLGLSRAGLYAALAAPIGEEQLRAYRVLLARRRQHEPVAYLTGRREFFGLDFLVDRRVLIPRPETEILVEEALRGLPAAEGAQVADIGTGSGAVAVSLAVSRPLIRVYAVDAAAAALAVAAANVARHGVASRVTLLQGDLLAPVPAPVDLIVANLPYIPSGRLANLEPEVRDYEPLEALDGGVAGLAVIGRLLAQAPDWLRPRGVVLLEIDCSQGEAIRALAGQHLPGAAVSVLPDLTGRDRVVRVVAPPSRLR